MNKTHSEAQAFAHALVAKDNSRNPRIQRFVIPSFTSVREVKHTLRETSVLVGAQNMHWADEGAWTGEISPLMLADCGLDIVEIGHSERRECFGETDKTVGLKTEAAVRHGLTPLICVGETLEERNSGNATLVLQKQVRMAFENFSNAQRQARILLAYEPVWAIGSNGIPATSEYADKKHAEIKSTAQSILNRQIPCLYGGSVNSDNCEEFIQQPHVDGLFIGRAAWNVTDYIEILDKCAAVV